MDINNKSTLLLAVLFCTGSVAAQISLPKIPKSPKPHKVSKGLNTEAAILSNSPYSISTIAGTGIVSNHSGSSGNKDAIGREAMFNNPFDIAMDGNGDFFIADFLNYRIRKMIADGNVSTYAGTNQGQEDGSLTTGKLYSPVSICFDNNGDMIIVDKNYNAIRKISKSGITTIAGGNGNGYKDGDAKTAQFNMPVSVAVNSKGDIFVCDSYNHRIRKISGNIVTTYAGNGNGGYADGLATDADFLYPKSIAIDAGDNVYVADNTTIRKITPAGMVSTLAGKDGVQGRHDGKGANASFSKLADITIGASGNLYVVDNGSYDAISDDHEENLRYRNGGAAIRIVSPDGTVQTIAGSYLCTNYSSDKDVYYKGRDELIDGPVSNAFLSYNVLGICVDKEENIYVTDAGFNCIRKISKQ